MWIHWIHHAHFSKGSFFIRIHLFSCTTIVRSINGTHFLNILSRTFSTQRSQLKHYSDTIVRSLGESERSSISISNVRLLLHTYYTTIFPLSVNPLIHHVHPSSGSLFIYILLLVPPLSEVPTRHATWIFCQEDFQHTKPIEP